MANYFFTDASGRKRGPVSLQELPELAASGVIKPHTQMENDTGRKGHAGQISGLFSASTPPSVPGTRTAFQTSQQIRTINSYFTMFWMSMAVTCLLLIFILYLRYAVLMPIIAQVEAGAKPEVNVTLLLGLLFSCFAAIIASIVTTVYFFMLLYQLWKLIPADIARTTPGKAVGFTFIPVFNLYWVFVSYLGLCKDMNETLRRQRIHHQVSEGLGLTLCVLIVLYCASAFLPDGFDIVVHLIGLTWLIVMIIFIKSVKDGAIVLLEQGGQ
jgi:hypothetical protein